MENDQRYLKGYNLLKRLDADAAEQILKNLADFAPDMGKFIVEFAYGDIYSRPDLDLQSRQISTIAALTAMGTANNQLKFHIGAALNIGITPREIIEVMYLTVVFTGFPSSLNAIYTAGEIFKARGVSVEKEAAPAGTRRERGLQALSQTSGTTGKAVIEGLASIAPEMSEFILDFSYGDVISRKVLSPKWKEYSMISAAVAKGNMIPQLKVHLRGALNVGCSQKEIIEVIMQMVVYAGFPAALNGLYAAREVFME
jgi:4-carboxymuconolactone decarboxylase